MHKFCDIKSYIRTFTNKFKDTSSSNNLKEENLESRQEEIIKPIPQKISVIIPTLQKAMKVLKKLLDILYQDEAVDEIWIINNAQEKLNFSHPKLKIYNSEENLYVNASWNLGISLIKNDKFLIINDDILGCENFVSKVAETGILDKPDTGLVVVETKHVKNHNTEDIDDIPIPIYYSGIPVTTKPFNDPWEMGNWGSVMFGRKDSYFEIPSDLKVYFGDNYLIQRNIAVGKKNYSFTGIRFNHIHWASSKDEKLAPIMLNDFYQRDKYLENTPMRFYSKYYYIFK